MINWHNRYAKILRENVQLFDPNKSVLEVGCGPQGVALWLQRQVVGLELEWHYVANKWITPVNGDCRKLPFDDNSFDFVVCVDVMEHLKNQDRTTALKELIRVARGRVLVSCPCGFAAIEGEIAFASLLTKMGEPTPTWLLEHLDCGIPKMDELIGALVESGYQFAVVGNESMFQHYAGLLLDSLMPAAIDWNSSHARKTVREPPIGEATWDMYYSFLFTLDKIKRNQSEGKLFPPTVIMDEKKETPTVAIYSVLHDPECFQDIGAVKYIYSGKASTAMRRGDLPLAMVDAEYLPNRRWSELSAIYTVWKRGPVTDVVGFCHYRRFFDFSPAQSSERQKEIDPSQINDVKDNFVCFDLIPRICDGLVVVAKPLNLQMSIFDGYATDHNANDYLLMLGIVSEQFPELLPYMAQSFSATNMYCNNMFVMNWKMFDQICSIWFPLLQNVCSRIPADRASTYQNRDISFLSERLLDPLINYIKRQGIEVKEYPIYFIKFPAVQMETTASMLQELTFDAALPDRVLSRTTSFENGVRDLQNELSEIKNRWSWRAITALRRSRIIVTGYLILKYLFRRARCFILQERG